MKKRSKGLYSIAVVLFLIFTLAPIVWNFIMSLTPNNELVKFSTQLLPTTISFANYQKILDSSTKAHQVVFNGLKNSIKLALYTTLMCVPLATLTAYGFRRYHFKWKIGLFRSLLITMVIPVFATIIPIFEMFAQFKLINNLFWVSVICVTAFYPLSTWMMYNHFHSIPQDLWDAAAMDGANEWYTAWEIILPASRNAILGCVLTVILMTWSQFQIPMILLTSQSNKVVTLILSEFMTRDSVDYGMIAASGLFTILPPLIIAIIFRRSLVSGLSSGSVKG